MRNTIFVSPSDDLQTIVDNAEPYSLINLSAGTYRQKVIIRTEGLELSGAGAGKTLLIYDDYAEKLDESGIAYNTFRTWTLAVCADHVTLRNLAVINDSLHPETKGQEVALSVVADDFLMEDCLLSSTQDTLFAGPLPDDLITRYDGFLRDELRRGGHFRQVYRNCVIKGSVDFIFGCADALFDSCKIHSVYDVRNTDYVAAPAHSLSQDKGFVFQSCDFTSDKEVMDNSIYLARPWRDYGLASFINCSYGKHISILGFDPWNDTRRDLTARFYESPKVEGRVSWINR